MAVLPQPDGPQTNTQPNPHTSTPLSTIMVIVVVILGLFVALSVIAYYVRASRTRNSKRLSFDTASPYIEPGPVRNGGWRNPSARSGGGRFGGGVGLRPYRGRVDDGGADVDVPPPVYTPQAAAREVGALDGVEVAVGGGAKTGSGGEWAGWAARQ
ncbi:hypothetical protein MMC11_004738 [Xylographa trunciseda]|nr:hypothetical protein [Xylographa trunciseda]